MFTGIIEAIGRVESVEKNESSARIVISADLKDNDLQIGDSLAVNGVCLTVTPPLGRAIVADIGAETLKLTTLGTLKAKDYVNLERPLKIGDRLGGHLVQGHVDGVGKILEINKIDNGFEVTLEAPEELEKYLVRKGSVTVDGASLTVTYCNKRIFKVFLIPHTMESTIFKSAKPNTNVNLEVDIIGKYVEKLTHLDSGDISGQSKITEEFLKKHGF